MTEVQSALAAFVRQLGVASPASDKFLRELEHNFLPVLILQILVVRDFNENNVTVIGQELFLVSRSEDSNRFLYLVSVNQGGNPCNCGVFITLGEMASVHVSSIT